MYQNLIYRLVSYTPTYIMPNHLSWFRIWAIPILWLSYTFTSPFVTFMLYMLACITDWFDGHLARTRGLVTHTGKRLDEVSDKVLVVGVLTILFHNGTITFDVSSILFWCVIIIVVRESVVTTLREMYPERARQVPSLATAKLKTAVMMFGFGLLILQDIQPFWREIFVLGKGLIFLSMCLAVYSGVVYVRIFSSARQ